MNILEKEKRLKELLEHNIKNEKVGTAIAITGPWGVGKTFFWKNFLDKQLSDERIYKKDNIFNRKYAYVSLFGLESLSDLKTQIYSSIESFHSSIEIPKWIKSLPSIFKETKVSQLGISAPAKIFDSLMFNQVKDAIICFDDFERMSNKLDIKDVMGLANYLKLEKNCQVILILDEDKTQDENKKKYAEYKEKLVDETIIINSVEALIRENAKGIEEPLVELMIKFAEALEIHNFRFFKKVINLYCYFRSQLSDELSDVLKKVILIRLIEGVLVEFFSNEYSWDDFLQNKNILKNEKFYKVINNANGINLLKEDFYFWFSQNEKFSFDKLESYVKSDNIGRKNRDSDIQLGNFLKRYDNLKFTENDLVSIDGLLEKIDIHESHINLIKIFFLFEDLELMNYKKELYGKLEQMIYDWIKERICNDEEEKFLYYLLRFFPEKHRFYDFVVKHKLKKKIIFY